MGGVAVCRSEAFDDVRKPGMDPLPQGGEP